MKYRTEEKICVKCGYVTRYKLTLTEQLEKYSGHFRQAVNAEDCPKCRAMELITNQEKKEGEKNG